MPVVTTMHTLVQEPAAPLRETTLRVVEFSERIVVMADRGRQMLEDIYHVDPAKIDVIPHGIPDVAFVDPNFYKQDFGVEGKLTILTFGLLSPGKGIENAIAALPEVVKAHPEVVYTVLGATHPNLVRTEGEAYRERLVRLAESLGVADHVIFHDKFVTPDELNRFMGAADIYLTPYRNEAQITSGTLAYAAGAGKPVVSTPYWHAQELLADGRGCLVPFGDPAAMARQINVLIDDEKGRHAMRRAAYKHGRGMVWGEVAKRYLETFEKARIPEHPNLRVTGGVRAKGGGDFPRANISHVRRMADATGMWQHARFNVPRFNEGYCTDDNARALLLEVMLEQGGGVPRETLLDLETASLAFLNTAFDGQLGRFRNFLSFDRRWLDEDVGSEDSHGRALWGLGYCAGHCSSKGFRTLAAKLFLEALPAVKHFSSPRAWAFSMLGVEPYLERFPGDVFVESMREQMTDHLMRVYESTHSEDWPWFEPVLAYANARLPHALLVGGRIAGKQDVVDTALHSLGWLMRMQTGETGCFSPIGSDDVYRRGGLRHHFDQQPIEAHASVSACLAAWRIAGDDKWYHEARRALDWFLGANDLGLPLYDPDTGGCRDGLHIDRVNENQGAESTLAFQLALAEMKFSQRGRKGAVRRPRGEGHGALVAAD